MWTVSAPHTSFHHRVAKATVTCIKADETPLANRLVRVEQVNHDFLFGNIGFDLLDYAAGGDTTEEISQIAEDYLSLFNATTLPFYLGRFEAVRGEPDTARTLAAARFFADHGQVLKGHPLVWHTVTPSWLNSLPLPEAERVLRKRIRREVTDFAGVIDMWDAINEAVIMPVFTAEENAVTKLAYIKGRIDMVRMVVEEAREANPNAFLLINDFDLGSAYECLIEGVLEAGISIDAIGLQTHMHQGYRGEEQILATVERFSRYGLPIHMTETSLVSGELMPASIQDLNDFQVESWPSTPVGEERQADEIRRHYTSLVSHPAVKVIVYWGLSDKGSWLGAPIGLLRSDGTRKPAYDELKSLVKGDWWIPSTEGRTDADGCFEMTGWLGTYDITIAGHTRRIHLGQPGHLSIEVRPTSD